MSSKTTSKRPDMRDYFRDRIDYAVNGMMASGFRGTRSLIPADVQSIDGTIYDLLITVTMRDGAKWRWQGGRYASRKVNGCRAPLMPKPIAAPLEPVVKIATEWQDGRWPNGLAVVAQGGWPEDMDELARELRECFVMTKGSPEPESVWDIHAIARYFGIRESEYVPE